jgi:hypothetical protein
MKIIDDETKALLWAGFIRPIDGFILAAEVVAGIVGFTWFIVKPPELVHVILYLFGMGVLGSIWILSVAYRACYFSLKCYAEMQTLPDRAGMVAHQRLMGSVNAAPGVPTGLAQN